MTSRVLLPSQKEQHQFLRKGQETRNPDVASMADYGKAITTLKKKKKTLLRYKENMLRKIINAELAITFNNYICKIT
ncbi:hypothetical protein E2C01_090550 [Portunus trituberculatus]|uniref:Uncharacterized protein n=1 Tax=Portunus trituberculatus TaxID=210409 RepID=A0A5B7JLP3_PORTR|nr:hypothetical protein [Portunus trituberculatus]